MILIKPKIRSPGFHTQWEGEGRGREREKGRQEGGEGMGGRKGGRGEKKNNLRGTVREGNENECIRVPQKLGLNWAYRADPIDTWFCRSRVGRSTSRALETAQCRLRTSHARA